jgi:hypothetical protein
MANRIPNPNLFAGLSPPWLLTSLDANSGFFQGGFNDSSLGWVNGIPIDTGSANIYTVALPFGSPTAYQDGMCIAFIPSNTNTGASTLTVSPLGSAAILNPAGIALQGGELPANRAVTLVYKSASPTGFRIIGPCPLSLNLQAQTGNITIECAGYTSIVIQAAWTSGSNPVTTLAHLAQGVPVFIELTNNIGSSQSFGLGGTNPAGTAFTGFLGLTSGSANGAANSSLPAGTVINNTFAISFTGGAVSASVCYFMR